MLSPSAPFAAGRARIPEAGLSGYLVAIVEEKRNPLQGGVGCFDKQDVGLNSRLSGSHLLVGTLFGADAGVDGSRPGSLLANP